MSKRRNITVRRLDENCAHVVPELYRAVYGDDFPLPSVYDPESTLRANREGRQVTMLAFSGDKAIAQAVVSRSAWNPRLYELMGLMVLPEYRLTPAASLMAKVVTEEILPSLDWEVRYTESTTAHDRSQRIDIHMGHIHCALALELLPNEAYRHDSIFSVSGRVGCIMSFMERPGLSPIESVLPVRYASALEDLADGFSRTFRMDDSSIKGEASLRTAAFPMAGAAYITVTDLGGNLAELLDSSMTELEDLPAVMLQMPLSSGIDQAVEAARTRGFRLGGYLPRWFEGADGLLLQKTGDPLWDEIKVLPPRGTALLDMVKSDREAFP